MAPPLCAYAFTASRNWLVGVLTLVSSLQSSNGPQSPLCGYRILWHPELADTVFTPGERELVETVAGHPKRVQWVRVNSTRLQQYQRLPYMREGALQSLVKLELFFTPHTEARSIVFLDVDMLVMHNLTFVHSAVLADWRNTETPWRLHGSQNDYGIMGGWVHSRETTPRNPKHINCGFFAFATPVPASFIAAVEGRIAERINKNIQLFSADQDVINTALHRTGDEQAVHTDWFANYRPNSDAGVAKWHVAHWLGITKPWGLKGHTRGEIRYNDRTLPKLDALWAVECRKVSLSAAPQLEALNMTLGCRTPERELPSYIHPGLVRAVTLGLAVQLSVLLTMRRARVRSRSGWAAAVVVSTVMWIIYLGLFGLSDAGWRRLCRTCKSDWLFVSHS